MVIGVEISPSQPFQIAHHPKQRVRSPSEIAVRRTEALDDVSQFAAILFEFHRRRSAYPLVHFRPRGHAFWPLHGNPKRAEFDHRALQEPARHTGMLLAHRPHVSIAQMADHLGRGHTSP